MALGKKYFSSFKSNINYDYYLEIWVEGQTASAVEITLGQGGPIIKYDTDSENRFSSIISSSLELPFLVTGSGTEFFVRNLRLLYQERDVYIHLYRSTSSGYSAVKPLWSGFLIMDLGAGEDVDFPYEQKLTFVDGLSLLKDIDFVDFDNPSYADRTQGNYDAQNMYYGPASYIYWIREILLKSGASLTGASGYPETGVSKNYGFTTAVNWYNEGMTNVGQNYDPLDLTRCVVSMFHTKDDEETYTPFNCYDVLKEILRHWGARITYWKGEFWIVQIPEYVISETGTKDVPVNINSRQYNYTGGLIGTQDHLGSTFYTRYEQTLNNNQISKLTGTKYDYLPMIKEVKADFLSLAGNNFYGGFPYGYTAPTQELFQGTITDPSTASYIWLSIPLNWSWDMGTSTLTNGHVKGWWCSVKFNFYAVKINSDSSLTTLYLQYNSSSGEYYWINEVDWSPLGNQSPKYIIKSRALVETNYIGFQEKILFIDANSDPIDMLGKWNFYLDIEDYGYSQSNPGSFFCRFSGYPNYSGNVTKRNPNSTIPNLPVNGVQTSSGLVAWSNTLQDPMGILVFDPMGVNPTGINAGTSEYDRTLMTTSPFKGFLQCLTTTSTSLFGISTNTQVTPASNNSEIFNFGTLIWGDAIEQFSTSSLTVKDINGIYIKTDPEGKWGRGTLSGEFTFTNILIEEFLTGQIKVIISPSMRITVGEANKNQGPSPTRPRYINPIGKLRETRNGPDPEYFFKRGSFFILYDEWDYEGYQILRTSVTSNTTNNNIGNLGQSQTSNPISNNIVTDPTTNALMSNSPLTTLSRSIPSLGANVSVNGNFNTAVGWSLGSGWSIDTTAKKALFTATGSTSELTQSVLTQGKPYQINFNVTLTAGSLLVKAGTSGTSETITTSGLFSIYLNCEGSNLIKFQASTTFTGSITGISIADQKSLTSLPITPIGTAVFKTGDTFNLINENYSETIPLTVTSNQGASDTSIAVTSTLLYANIDSNAQVLINQDDLSAQYQNKTKGTVAGYGITSTGIAKSGINITGWLNSDTMTGATINNVPTALSVKNYIDGQPGHDETLAQVLSNGNVTGGTNISVNDNDKITFGASADLKIYHDENNSYIDDTGVGLLYIRGDAGINITSPSNNGEVYAKFVKDAGCEFRYNDGTKLITTNTGISITGGGVFTGQVTIPATPIATTDSASKIYVDTQVASIPKGLSYQGTWNAFTNTPTIVSGVGVAGYYWIVSVAGTTTIDGISEWKVGDWIIFSDSGVYQKIDQSEGDTLQTVTTRGSTTTTGATFGGNVDVNGLEITVGTNSSIFAENNLRFKSSGAAYIDQNTTGQSFIFRTSTSSSLDTTALTITNVGNATFSGNLTVGNGGNGKIYFGSTSHFLGNIGANVYLVSTGQLIFEAGGSEKMRLLTNGNFLINSTSDNGQKLQVNGDVLFQNSNAPNLNLYRSGTGQLWNLQIDSSGRLQFKEAASLGGTKNLRLQIDDTGEVEVFNNFIGTTATFTGLVSGITPVGVANFATKGYVDGQIGATDSLQEVTTIGNTTTNSITIGSSSSPSSKLEIIDTTVGTTPTDNDNLFIKLSNKSVTSVGETWGIGFNSNNAGTDKLGAFVSAFGHYSSNYNTSLIFGTRDTSGNATERMRLTSGGSLLLGTTTGTEKLVVAGNIQVNGSSDSSDGLHLKDSTFIGFSSSGSVISRFRSSATGTFQFQDGSYNTGILLKTNGNSYFNGGNLGVGTENPIALIHLSNTNGGPFYIEDSNSTNTYSITSISNGSGNLSFDTRNSSGGFVSTDYQIIKNQNGSQLQRWFIGSSEKMALTSTGLGIGTSSPTGILHVKKTDSSTYWLGKFEADGTTQNALLVTTDTQSGTGVRFDMGGSTGTFTVLNSSRVGIGIVSPATPFHVVGRARFDDQINAKGVFADYFSSGQPLTLNSGGSAWISFQIGGGSEKMRLSPNGLGIGTSSPQNLLHLKSNDPKIYLEDGNAATNEKVYVVYPAGSQYVIQTKTDAYGTGQQAYVIDRTGTTVDGQNWYINSNSVFSLNSSGNATFTGLVSGITPTSENNLATKSYVDAHGGGLGPFLPLTGGTLTGGLTGTTATFNGNLRTNTLLYIQRPGVSAGVAQLEVTGSGLTIIGPSGYHPLIVQEAGVEKFRIQQGSGNVGIGTTIPTSKLSVTTSNNNDGFRLNYPSTNSTQYPFYIGTSSDSNYVRVNASIIALKRNGAASTIKTEGSSNDLILQSQRNLIFNTNEANEKARITDGGSLLIGTTTNTAAKLSINQSSTTDPVMRLTDDGVANYDFIFPNTNTLKLETNTTSTKTFKLLNAGTGGFNLEASEATFSGQVTIPATPVATTDAASKSYVDAHGGGLGPFLPLTGGTLTGSLTGTTATFNGNITSSNSGGYSVLYGSDRMVSSGTNLYLNFASTDPDVIIGPSDMFRAYVSAGYVSIDKLLINTTTDSGEKLQILGNAKLSTTTNTNVELKLNPYSSGLGTSYAWNLIAANSANNYSFDIKQGTNSVIQINNTAASGNNNITLAASLTGTTGTFTGSITSGPGNNFDPIIREGRTASGPAYSFLNDLDTGMFNPNLSNTIAFSTGGSEKMRLSSGGNLLIGNTSGGRPLTVNSDTSGHAIRILENNSANESWDIGVDVDGDLNFFNSADTSSSVSFQDNGSTNFSGHLTAASFTGQHFQDTSDSSKIVNPAGASSITSLSLSGSLTGTTATFSGNITFPSNKGLEWGNGSTVRVENNVLKLGASGGIDLQSAITGTTATFSTSGFNSALILNNTDTNYSLIQYNYSGAAKGFSGYNSGFMLFGGESGVTTRLQSGGAYAATILTNGNFLIGTTTDSGAKLSVVGSPTTLPLLVLRNTGTASSNDIYMGYNRDNSTGSNGWSTGIDSTDNAFHISEDADSINNDVRLKISAGGSTSFSGNMSIGGSAGAVYKLDVVGKARVQSVLELENVLTLNAISTPSNPANNTSSIWMDESGDIKVKINVEGTIVTRIIASFES